MSFSRRTPLTCVLVLAGAAAGLRADTLYLRDGSRVQGELIEIRNRTIEFAERRGFERGRTLRFDRDEVVRIDFEVPRPGHQGRDPAGRPGGLRERMVTVSANVPWNDTGIDVRAGQTIYFQASGEVRWGKDRRDGPDGERNSPSNPARPLPSRNAAALIGSIGSGSGDVFFIGDDAGEFRLRSSGRLYLGVNDDFLQDNSGNFRVVVYY